MPYSTICVGGWLCEFDGMDAKGGKGGGRGLTTQMNCH
jgi:hypothetical protein